MSDADTVTVTVRDGWLVHDGLEPRGGGERLDVPAEVAERWTAAGWVEPVAKPKTKPRRRRT